MALFPRPEEFENNKIKILIGINTSWNFINFRSGLISALVREGYEVVALAPPDEYSERLSALGCRFVPIYIDGKGINPLKDLWTFLRFMAVMIKERPDIYLGYTIKPNIYGSLAAQLLRIPVINNIAGLGSVFIKESWLTRLVRRLYRFALLRSSRVFFQNIDDKNLFLSDGLVGQHLSDLVPGSGINIEKFAPLPMPVNDPIRFLLIARMLKDKGVVEFVEAARQLKLRGIKAECCLLGFLDVQNPAAILRSEIDDWIAEGAVRYLGVSEDVREEIAQADCIILPSYREGTPRVLLEAAAMARPIVATDAAGCREVVDDGINGYLCRARDPHDLADKMSMIVDLSPGQRELMGRRGREKVEITFDEKVVVNRYLMAISKILGLHSPR